MRNTVLPLMTALCLAAIPSAATAGEVTIEIELGDLDPTQFEDALKIESQIDTAVTRACRNVPGLWFDTSAMSECIADGKAKAFEAVSERNAADIG